ncbi:MAG: hypothetical protein RLZZ628_2781 [Bacteroidota bacterium]
MNYTDLKMRLPPFLLEWTASADCRRLLAILHRYGLSLGICVVGYCAGLTGTVTGNSTSTVLLPTSEFAANRPPGTLSTRVLNDNIKMLLCPKCYGMERLVFMPPKPIQPLKINKLKTKSRRAKRKPKPAPKTLPIVTITI